MSCWMIYELVLDTIFFIVCVGTFVWTIISYNFKEIFLNLEHWMLWVQSLYYFLIALVGYMSLCNDAKSKTFQKFSKNYLFKYICVFSLTSPGIFYLGYFLKWFDGDFDTSGTGFLLTILVHGGVQIPLIVDTILFKREYKPNVFCDFIVFTAIFVGYCFLCIIANTDPNYKFRSEDFKFKIAVFVFWYLVLLLMYVIYQTIVKMRFGIVGRLSGGERSRSSTMTEKINDIDAIQPSSEMTAINNTEEDDAEKDAEKEPPKENNDDE